MTTPTMQCGWKIVVGTVLATATLAAFATLAVWTSPRSALAQDARTLRVVVHINFAQTTHERHALRNISNILKAAGDDGLRPRIEVVCHGDGIRLVEKARSELADELAALAERGVRFDACRNTMRERSIQPADLLPEVVIVPSGAYQVVRLQHEGYAYLKP